VTHYTALQLLADRPRIVSMSNPLAPDWSYNWLRNGEYARGRQWLVFDEER
jgi:hypothetical protein